MSSVVLLVFAIYFIFSGLSELKTTLELKRSIAETQAKTTELKKKKKDLETKKKNLSDPDYIEYIARGKYLVTKEGEQVFKFPESEN